VNIEAIYFGAIREQTCGKSREAFEYDNGTTVDGFVSRLGGQYPQLARLRGHLKVAVNGELAAPDHVLQDGDEVVLIRPVTSGAGGRCRIVAEPLDVSEITASVVKPGHGNVATSSCFVRDHSHTGAPTEKLEFDIYTAAAVQRLGAIIEQCEASADGVRVAIVHRVGVLSVGEIIRVVAVGAPSLRTAYEILGACTDLMRDLPVWKKEIGVDGQEWVNAAGYPILEAL
jgi:molybdopterin synthase catalytic subunit